MAKNTSISLGPHFEKFIRREIKGGRFGTASEVVRAGLRLLEQDEAKLTALRRAIAEGEASGLAEDYSLEGIMKEARRRVGAKNASR
jgi:antitoxin ParD1/3/4